MGLVAPWRSDNIDAFHTGSAFGASSAASMAGNSLQRSCRAAASRPACLSTTAWKSCGYHLRTKSSAHPASLSAWHRLQALGDLKARVAAGVGGSIEWSVRPIAANRVVGMWQETHRLPALPLA